MRKSLRKDKAPNVTHAQRARSLKTARAETAREWPVGKSPALVAPVIPGPNSGKSRLIEGDSAYRKMFPLADGFMDYFPDAMAEASRVSYFGNAKHNPGEPMHHARGKSTDHANCIMRHLMERGGFDVIVVDGVEHKVRHSAALLWRAAALCQEEIENELGLPLPRGAKA